MVDVQLQRCANRYWKLDIDSGHDTKDVKEANPERIASFVRLTQYLLR